jgi:glutamate/tyrosine decarboxylase-like PLP-dependent enzyme
VPSPGAVTSTLPAPDGPPVTPRHPAGDAADDTDGVTGRAGAALGRSDAVVRSAAMDELRTLLATTAATIADFRAGLREARVVPTAGLDEVVAALDRPLPDGSTPAAEVVADLVRAAGPGLVATAGPRYFGYVIGGSADASLCADLLAVGWDQHVLNAVTSPAGTAVEQVAGRWLKEVLGLPAGASVGFVTGAQAANTVGLAAARHQVLADAGWDVERGGLNGAPAVRIVVGAERHATIDRSLRLLGFGDGGVEVVAARADGAMDPAALAETLAAGDADAPTIVCAQVGNVTTGACDDLAAVCAAAHGRRRRAWVHVDGAFGLWAAASPTRRHLVAGIEQADSWGCDGHKWLNVPYDSGFAFCAHPAAHVAAMNVNAVYLQGQGGVGPSPTDLVPESSRRARGFAVWAAIRELGRSGIADLVDRCCDLAQRFADQLGAVDGIEIVNDVVLNQVAVRFGPSDEHTDRVIDALQREGTCWAGGTTWRGRRLLRISVSNWSTTEADVDRSVVAITRLHREVGRGAAD